MTTTDKIEIENLLQGMKEMDDYARTMNGKFIDEKVIAFANEARKDYLDNKRYLMKVIQENLPLFFNLDKFEVSTSGSCCDGYYAMRGEKFSHTLCGGIHLVLRMRKATVIENTGYHITFKVDDLEVINIFYYTSDTKNEGYRVCCATDLVDRNIDYPYDTPKTASEWHYLYCAATWTREKNKWLVNQFKKSMREHISLYRASANANEKVRNNLKAEVGVYVKVDL